MPLFPFIKRMRACSPFYGERRLFFFTFFLYILYTFLFRMVFGILAVIILVVLGLIGWCAWRFCRKKRPKKDDKDKVQDDENALVENEEVKEEEVRIIYGILL